MRANGSRAAGSPHRQLIPELVRLDCFGPPLWGEAGRTGNRAEGERAGAIILSYNPNPVTQDSTNPFLAPRAYETLPDFAAIRPEHVEPAIRALAASLSADLARVEREVVRPPGTLRSRRSETSPNPSSRRGAWWGTSWGSRTAPSSALRMTPCKKTWFRIGMRIAQSKPIYRALVGSEQGPGLGLAR